MSDDATLEQTKAHGFAEGVMPERIGKYELQSELGRGTCGVVYKAFDPFVQRDVAIKIALSRDDEDDGNDEATLHKKRTFFSEAHAAGILQHPHIVQVYDAGIEDDLSYIVMEYVSGTTLLPHCGADESMRLPVEQSVDIAFKCCKALDFSHKRGVLHRDIKPSNIMLTEDRVAKIMDFSIAEIMQEMSVTPDEVVGSPMYMAPEQIRKQKVGPAADLYSLGAVLYQMLTGQPPFLADDVLDLFHQITNQPAPDLRIARPDLPDQLADIIAKSLAKNPDDRWQSGADFGAQLLRLFDNLRHVGRQIERRESRDSLKSLRFFRDFTNDEIDEILQASKMLNFSKGETIIQEGDIDNSFYIMALGEAEVQKSGNVIQTLHKGDCFGEIGFLLATKRTASIVAKTEVLALKVNSTLMDNVSADAQLRYYKVFTETLIYRLSVTSAQLSAKS